MDNLQDYRDDDRVPASEGQRRWAEGWRAADRQRRDRAPSPRVLTTRAIGAVFSCPHCGRRHQLNLEAMGLVTRPACGRGGITVVWPSEEES